MKPHKHAELIKAWADGAEIEAKLVEKRKETAWELCLDPWWNDPAFEYRIKPEPKPDVVRVIALDMALCSTNFSDVTDLPIALKNSIRVTFDGETGELKSAEVLK